MTIWGKPTVTGFSTDRAMALRLDSNDPLAALRDRFIFDDPSLIYLDGNSLGRLPRATVERVERVVRNEWGAGLIGSWDEWLDLPIRVGDLLGAHLLGAAPGPVGSIATSTTACRSPHCAPRSTSRPRWSACPTSPTAAARLLTWRRSPGWSTTAGR